MRPIKFRAWDKEHSRYVKVVNIQFKKGKPSWITTIKKGAEEIGGIASMFILLQYTGLKDKNGKEIYEGDVLKYKGYGKFYTSEVRWFKAGWWHFFKAYVKCKECKHKEPVESRDSLFYVIDQPMQKEVEVIGNIYENPELLRG